jgi:hypothetical protein
MAIGRIHEVDLAEGALLHEGEHEGVDLGPDGTMTSRASDWRPRRHSVDDAKTWVKANRLAGEDRLCLDERVDARATLRRHGRCSTPW